MEKTPILGPSLRPKKLKKLTGALGCMHKAPKCIQSLWDHPKKIPFVQKYKESAICAILREKTPFYISRFLVLLHKGIFSDGPKGIECIWELCGMQPRAPVSFLSFLGPEGRPQNGGFFHLIDKIADFLHNKLFF